MADLGGLLDDAWQGWTNWWDPKEVPKGAAYTAQDLGMARANAIGNFGGTMLALAQGGVSPDVRARLLAGLGDAPLSYTQTLLAGGEGRLKAAQVRKLEAEEASQKQFGTMVDDIIRGREGGGGYGPGSKATPSGAPVSPAVYTPGNSPARIALAALKMPESGGKADIVNPQGYSGLFQIGTSLAAGSGLYKPAQDEAVADEKGRAVNAWRGQWTIPGFEPMTHQQWLQNPAAQQKAGEIAMETNWKQIQAEGLDKYVGQTVGGVTITPQALLQAAWMGGVGGLKTWLTGQGDPADSNKATVSRWAALTPPAGTMTDAGTPAPVPGSGGSTGAPGGGPQHKGDLSQLTTQQLRLLQMMTPAERAQWLLSQSSKYQSTPLTAAEKQQYGLDPGSVYVYDENGKPQKLQDAKARDLSVAEKVRLGYPSDAVIQIKPDGTYFEAKPGSFKRLGPDELKQEGHRPDAIVERGPDGKTNILDKGRDPNAPINEGDARSLLAELAPRVREGKIDPNSPEGLRYRAAYDLLEKGRQVDQQLPNGKTQQITIKDPVPFPRLGEAPQTPAPIVTKQAPPLTESQSKTQYHLGVMTAANNRMEALMKTGWKEGQTYDVLVNGAPNLLANWFRTPEGQRYKQAQVDWTMAKMRWESGANIQEHEAENESIRYFPQPGDKPETVKQKNEARQTAIANMRGVAGLHDDGDSKPTTPARSDATPLPPDETPASIVNGINQRIRAGKMTREEGLKIMKKYDIHESFLPK